MRKIARQITSQRGGASKCNRSAIFEVAFPHGTEFRATYKGQLYAGVVAEGSLVVQGKRFTSPTSAAVAITGSPVSRWRFWECLLPGRKQWKLIVELRGLNLHN